MRIEHIALLVKDLDAARVLVKYFNVDMLTYKKQGTVIHRQSLVSCIIREIVLLIIGISF